ncbi:MAG: hypothetical protein GEU78_12395 [Actinobacteria bacterium]|nr:hypothetical protein [Actinomycetota bacterium]
MAVKALACELPAATGAPLARWHCPDLARAVVEQGIAASVSDTTIWRWLSADAIKPWRHRSWIFPRDPDFAASVKRLREAHDNARLIHLPVHASWLNQVEIYGSFEQRVARL